MMTRPTSGHNIGQAAIRLLGVNVAIGQATLGIKIMEQMKDVDAMWDRKNGPNEKYVILPTSVNDGCGLTASIALAIKVQNPNIKIVFFRVMRAHYQIMAEAERFNSIISESRASLNYISSKVSKGMDQMKEDIAKELFITDHLTKLSSKVGLLLQRYSELEEGLIELVRMNHNTKSVRIETPADINEEVKCILAAARKRQSQPQQQQSDRPRTPRKLRISTNASAAVKDHQPYNSVVNSRFLTSQSYDTDLSNVTTLERQERPRTPAYPEVQLLNDPRPATDAKPIGFRPSWKCET